MKNQEMRTRAVDRSVPPFAGHAIGLQTFVFAFGN
jgi:hypothetical protein